MRHFLCVLSLVYAVGASASPLSDYFCYLDKYPTTLGSWGNAAEGEIEIIRNEREMGEVEKKTGRLVGVMAEDKYWLWLNDAVRFPNGKEGVYGRLLWKQTLHGHTGVAVMPLLPNGKIALLRNYRHATRSWEYELPRGGIEVGEAVFAAARREVKEETGLIVDKLCSLGEMASDTGITQAIVPIFLAKVVAQEEAQPEDSEAIAAIEGFTIEELKQGFKQGFLVVGTKEDERQIPLRDPFLAFALFQAELRGSL